MDHTTAGLTTTRSWGSDDGPGAAAALLPLRRQPHANRVNHPFSCAYTPSMMQPATPMHRPSTTAASSNEPSPFRMAPTTRGPANPPRAAQMELNRASVMPAWYAGVKPVGQSGGGGGGGGVIKVQV